MKTPEEKVKEEFLRPDLPSQIVASTGSHRDILFAMNTSICLYHEPGAGHQTVRCRPAVQR